jgi:hypothetical protein
MLTIIPFGYGVSLLISKDKHKKTKLELNH